MKYLGVISGVNDNYRPTRISVFVPCLLQLKPPNLICRHLFLSLKLENAVYILRLCVFCEINVAIIIKLSGLLNYYVNLFNKEVKMCILQRFYAENEITDEQKSMNNEILQYTL